MSDPVVAKMAASSDFGSLLARLHRLWRAGRVPLSDYLRMTEENSHRFNQGRATEQWKAEMRGYLEYVGRVEDIQV